jgi:hypothetical protein
LHAIEHVPVIEQVGAPWTLLHGLLQPPQLARAVAPKIVVSQPLRLKFSFTLQSA